MKRIRAYISGLLVLALLLTGHGMAVARGMPGAAGYAELCIGASPVMVPVDAEGNPTGPPHICPDFSLSLLNWVPEAPILPVPVMARSERAVEWYAVRAKVIRQVAATARSPPVWS